MCLWRRACGHYYRSFACRTRQACCFVGRWDTGYTERSQAIYKGKSIGEKYSDYLYTLRLRYFGGTSGHWGGRCALFNSTDFESRGYHGLPGWPIKLEEIHGYLDRAKIILDLPSDALTKVKGQPIGDGFEVADKAHSDSHFGDKYFDELKGSKDIDVYINANVVNIVLSSDLTQVKQMDVINYEHEEFTALAGQYVLALGAVENARLLLNCNKQMERGIGNYHDMVGRCFMEHFNVRFGRFVVEDKKYWANEDGQFEVVPTKEKVVKEKLGNAVFQFKVKAEVQDYGNFRALKHVLRGVACGSEALTGAARSAFDLNCTGDGLITSMIEQIPNLDSRVMLGAEKDSLGLKRVKLDWQVTDADRRTIRVLGLDVAKDMARMKAARIQLNDFVLDPTIKITNFGAHAHQMGTTRMSLDPKYGVVDSNCKIHGLSNFYVAGSSVFPTGGGTNPTITIVMLALRLGEHLLKKTL